MNIVNRRQGRGLLEWIRMDTGMERRKPPPWDRESACKTWSNAGGSPCAEPGGGPSTPAGETPFCNVCVGSRARWARFWAGFHGKGAVEMPAGPRFDRNYRHGRYFSGGYGHSLSVYRHQRCTFGPERPPPAPDPASEWSRKEGGATDTGVANYRHGRYFNPLHYRH